MIKKDCSWPDLSKVPGGARYNETAEMTPDSRRASGKLMMPLKPVMGSWVKYVCPVPVVLLGRRRLVDG